MSHRLFISLFAPLLSALLSACGSLTPADSSNRFHLISALTEQSLEQRDRITIADHGPTIEIAPVTLPSYLNRPYIVTRRQPGQIEISEWQQWGGDLSENLSRVLEENLALLLHTHRIVEPRQRTLLPADMRVTVQILHFERSGDQTVQLIARWRLSRRERSEPLMTRRSDIRVPTDATASYDTIVAAMSQAFADLSREIAVEVTRTAETLNPK
ncbi:MAG: membrane integrity-associated transporter subunit PqiC [Magnetococcales bacterium]|nr:membrane integrity-associated transporter subunit PqiC [Magnetococcales bacterium]